MQSANIHTGKRIMIAGGGTGGHIFPAIAIANAIKKIDPMTTFLFVGAKGKMEMEKVPQAGYAIEGITIAGFNRSSLMKNLGLPFKLIKSFFQVAAIIRRFRPDAVIGVGGYSSFPVLRFAQSKGIPTFIHEANSFAGKSNIMLGKLATKIFTATDGMEKFFPANKIMVSGNPVRASIVSMNVDKTSALKHFGLNPGKKTILCVGGSLGAKSINEAIEKDIALFAKNDLQLIWQTGKPFLFRAKNTTAGMTDVYVNDFIQEMEMGYAAADIVISRSGAMSISELCIVGKPVVFVPYPFAAEDHQTANAQKLVKKDAAIMIEDKNAMQELVPKIIELSHDETKQNIMKKNIEALKITNADECVANEIMQHLK